MQDESPLDAIRTWIGSQPTEVQSSIYFIVGLKVVDMDNIGDVEFIMAPQENFDAWIDKKLESSNDDIVAAAICLRELIQFFVIDHFGSPKQWDSMVTSIASVASEFHTIAPGSEAVQSLENNVQSAPFRRRLWARAAADWNSFIKNSLTNKHLLQWRLLNNGA